MRQLGENAFDFPLPNGKSFVIHGVDVKQARAIEAACWGRSVCISKTDLEWLVERADLQLTGQEESFNAEAWGPPTGPRLLTASSLIVDRAALNRIQSLIGVL